MIGIIAAELRRFGRTALWSWDGWRAAWATEKSLRQWTVVNLLSAALALTLDLGTVERALILALGLLILAAELANTALETLCNHVQPDLHPAAKKIKDCGSAMVALTAIAGGIAWIVLLVG